MERIYKRIGQNVRKAREERGVSQLALALEMGHKAVGSVSLPELNLQRKHFNIEHLVKIAQILEIDDLACFFEGIWKE
ncbi:MAG: helix-turn-helix domain-containing protein [Helicobacteraceae bacterium]|jgi:ribosome-binding protein aMBF1 (putative translation factor)|nr:helix-turn-helix domain-containing protein [Helicobacteraceae bacterium]